jgi:hypothetical protein
MNESDPAERAVPRPDLFGGLRDYYPHTSMLQSIHGDLTSALLDFDAVDYPAFTPAPASTGTFTNPTNPPTYAYPVSKQQFDDRH